MSSSIAYATPDSNISNVEGLIAPPPKAPQACLSCRRQKRRCDKKIPACSLCERMNRPCDYSDASPAPTAEDFNALRQRLIELEGRLLGSTGNANANANANGNANVMDHGPAYQPTSSGSLSASTRNVHHSPIPAYVHGPSYQQVQNRFPVIAFLDGEAFMCGRVAVPSPHIEIPLEVLEILGDGSAVQAVISDYFETIHTWMPIVSKKRLTRNMLNPMWEAGPDLALLFLCMKLVISRPQEGLENTYNPIYAAAKRFLALMEAGGMVSLMMLQTYILVALYEMGQSIYPAAWMTVGSSVRYGQLLGVHDPERAPQLLIQASTWTEMEERRRSWWGVVIIDRLVALGSAGRFLSCEDPDDATPLPVPTSAWDEGQSALQTTLSVSSPLSDPACPFARLCQAANLLGKVLRHHRQIGVQETELFRQASALYLELSDLVRILLHEAANSQDYLVLAPSMAVCFSALCALYDPYACHGLLEQSSPEETTMQIQALEGLKALSDNIIEFSRQVILRTPHSLDIDRVSPFVMDSLYAAAAHFAWEIRESGNEASQESLDNIRQCLQRFGGRWRSSHEYLRILEAQEFTYAVGSG